MKFEILLKDPDGLYEAINEAVRDEVASLNLPTDEAEVLIEKRREKVSEICSRWFEFGEYLGLEVDTEAKTIKVKEIL